MERLMLEAVPEPPVEISGAEVLRRFDRPTSEWAHDDYAYGVEVVTSSLNADEGAHEQLVRKLMDRVRKARHLQEAHEDVQGAIRHVLDGGRSQTLLGRLSLRFDRWISRE